MFTKYEKEARQLLAAYRFLSYALAVMFIQISRSLSPASTAADFQIYIVLGILGVYSVLRVFSPLRWREKALITYIILAGDFLIGMILVSWVGGLDSPFLLYSLAPIMTAALLFEERVAVVLAGLATITLSINYLARQQPVSLIQSPNLALLIVYALFCFVTALVPYRTNLNIRRRIESESIIEERRRIARELHDGVAQSLGFLNMKIRLINDLVASHNTVRAINELGEIRKVVQDSYEGIRESIDQLSAEMVAIPLVPALASYVRDFGIKNTLKISFDCSRPFPELSPVAELQVFRISQEALTNIRRHAQATEIEIRLACDKDGIDLLIKDNGHGFTLDNLDNKPANYHGLNIIKERAEMLGGVLSVSTAPGEGTTLMVSLPLEKVRL